MHTVLDYIIQQLPTSTGYCVSKVANAFCTPTACLVSENYGYNIRGALTSKSSPVFSQTISFEGLNNGSVAKITDTLDGLSSTNTYEYDPAGRLWNADIKVGGNNRSTAYSYDANSNITYLMRWGADGAKAANMVDELYYEYDGNRVRNIYDCCGAAIHEQSMDFADGADDDIEYTYDANGNTLTDSNKGVRYTWDYNNMLSSAKTGATVQKFTYTAAGKKLAVQQESAFVMSPLTGLKAGVGLQPWPGGGTLHPVHYPDPTNYYGPYIYRGNTLKRLNTTTGYRDSEGTHVYVRDWQGNVRAVVSRDGGSTIFDQTTYYYPYGLPMAESTEPQANPYKYTAKELLTDQSLNLADHGARMYDPTMARWLSADPLSHDYPQDSHYLFCAGDPINFIDQTGLSWRPTYDYEAERFTGYEWVDPEQSYDKDGNLLPGLYEQAIFFSNEGINGTFDSSESFNIGTSTATVYKADGTTEEFNACTNPSDASNCATIPEGIYEAGLGKHRDKYMALRMGDVGTSNFYNNYIELGKPNPSNENTTKAGGVNIHKAGINNKTGMFFNRKTNKLEPISAGCMLIDVKQWNSFISHFEKMGSSPISVTLSRSLAKPTNRNNFIKRPITINFRGLICKF